MIDYSLHLVTDDTIQDFSTLKNIILQSIEEGVTIVQLREKKLSTKKIIEKAKKIKIILDKKNIPLIINDRVDVVLAIDAAGVHIGQDDMPYNMARTILGKNKIIGLSISTIAHMEQAKGWDVDYFGVGHIFTTPTKENKYPPLEMVGLQKVRMMTSKKIIAIGGINETNVKKVIRAGADGVAVVSAICKSNDAALATKKLKEQITWNK